MIIVGGALAAALDAPRSSSSRPTPVHLHSTPLAHSQICTLLSLPPFAIRSASLLQCHGR